MVQGEMTVTDDEILAVMERSDDPAFITSELADEFDMTTEGIRRRLNQLEREGRIHKKKPSARTVIWWADSDHDESAFSA